MADRNDNERIAIDAANGAIIALPNAQPFNSGQLPRPRMVTSRFGGVCIDFSHERLSFLLRKGAKGLQR